MNTYFCADNSRNLNEDIIGSAPTNEIYILIECPTPWEENAFNSRQIPSNLRCLKEQIQKQKISINLLLVNKENSKNLSKKTKSVIVFKKKQDFSNCFSRLEMEVQSLEDVAPLIESYLNKTDSVNDYSDTNVRDILICTHGSHDKCCAKYGIPFYREALATVKDLQLTNVNVWQSSHFGGHRFAPTAIDFPEGRYYGDLDQNTFRSILMRTGDISCIKGVYRGWGILSIYAQVLERELILLHGWEWFEFNAKSKIISQNEDKTFNRVEITYRNSNNILHSCTADIVKDENKTLYLKGSCNGKESERIKFRAENLVRSMVDFS